LSRAMGGLLSKERSMFSERSILDQLVLSL